MTIEADDPRLTAYALGELDNDELAAFTEALGSARDGAGEGNALPDRLQSEVDDIRRTAELLAREFDAAEPLSFSDRQRAAVFSAGTEDRGAGTDKVVRPETFSRVSRWLGITAAAACVMGASAIGIKHFILNERAEVAASEEERVHFVPDEDAGTESVGLKSATAEGVADTTGPVAEGAAFAQAGKLEEPQAGALDLFREKGRTETKELRERGQPEGAFAGSTGQDPLDRQRAAMPDVEASEEEAGPAAPRALLARGLDAAGGAAEDLAAQPGAGAARDEAAYSQEDAVRARGAVYGAGAPMPEPDAVRRKRVAGIATDLPPADGAQAPPSPAAAPLPPGEVLGGAATGHELKSRLAPARRNAESPEEIDGFIPGARRDEERRADAGGEDYRRLYDTPFIDAFTQPFSTFSIDVDTGSYTNVRRFLTRNRQLPPRDAVRVEELINYFDYDYPQPEGDHPYDVHVEVASCPWQPGHRLVKVGLKAADMNRGERPPSNLVFLVDVSGSMRSEDKLPLLKHSLLQLVRSLTEDDYITIVTYASGAGVVLEPTDGGQVGKIKEAIESLRAGGSTNGEGGIRVAYEMASKHFLPDGTNRVILATDGDFNVGTSNTEELTELVHEKATRKDKPIFLTVLGFGTGNLKDHRMEQIANKGNGVYFYIDSQKEGHRVLVEKLSSSLVAVAKDVKLQVDFNPAKVSRYRLIGYANRRLRKEDFRDDKVDAGEIGAGHAVTALYEIVPVGADEERADAGVAIGSKYLRKVAAEDRDAALTDSEEMLTVFTRYKLPDGEEATEFSVPLTDSGKRWEEADEDFRFAASVAGFGMLLRDSEFRGQLSYELLSEIVGEGIGDDESGLRTEFLELVSKAREFSGK